MEVEMVHWLKEEGCKGCFFKWNEDKVRTSFEWQDSLAKTIKEKHQGDGEKKKCL